MSIRILVVDDDQAFRTMLCEALLDQGYEVEKASSAEEGVALVRKGGFDLILHDVKLPGMSGIEALPHIKEADPTVDVIVMTAYASKDSGVEAMQRGAYDYFTKPFRLSEMEVVVRRALEKRRLQRQLSNLRHSLDKDNPLNRIIGDSPTMRQVKDLVERVAELDANVLIIGETGTGKELISDTIHALSRRASGPFVKLNCAAIPENLLESELFGHEKGAFTGAASAKQGKFELARGGTILLDEIGDMPLHLQPKLLRAVEQKQVERLGGSKPVSFDVRIIAATNQMLAEQVEDKRFRSDLYYRLNVAAIHLPALRERKEDIPQLAETFLKRVNPRLGTNIHSFSSGAMQRLFEYDWPGNVRQLANAVERMAIFCRGELIHSADVDIAFQRSPAENVVQAAVAATPGPALPESGIPLRRALQDYERQLIAQALGKSGGKQTVAADLLGISPKNLWNKLQKHAINPADFSK